MLTFLPLRLRAACGPAPFPNDSGCPTKAAPRPSPRTRSPSRAPGLLARFGHAPPTPRAWCPRRPAGTEVGTAGAGGRLSGRRLALSGWLPEFAQPPAFPGGFSARAGRCGGTSSRGSAPGTSLILRPPWSRLVAAHGPTAAPRSTGWRSCYAARVGKDRPSRGLPGGPRRGAGVFSNLRFPPFIPVSPPPPSSWAAEQG